MERHLKTCTSDLVGGQGVGLTFVVDAQLLADYRLTIEGGLDVDAGVGCHVKLIERLPILHQQRQITS